MAASKPTAVHFSLMFFVMLSIILGVVSYLNYRDLVDNQAATEKAKADAAKLQKARQDMDDEIQALKKLIGHEFEQIGLDDEQNPNTVLGAILADIRKYGDDPSQSVYSATIRKLRQELDTLSSERNALEADSNDLKAKMAALQGQYQGRVDQHQKAKDKAEADLQKLVTAKEEELKAKTAEIDKFRNAYSQVQLELEQTREANANEVKKYKQEIANLTVINYRLRKKFDEATKQSFEVPDGLIRWIDHTRGLVWINLGEIDKLPKRTTFSVYSKSHHGVGRGEEDIKGSIEVTRIIGPHLAEARILKDDIYRPMAPDDPVYTPLWSPGRRESFSFVGLIDVDSDGLSDRRMLHEMLAAAGATIDNEVDDQGNRTGEGITVHTKFLVIGELPDPTQSRPKDREHHEKILKQHSDMMKEARQQGVRVVNLSDFLAYIGFKPSRRLWVPGAEVTGKLKSGSHSTAVNATLGNRESTGRTSGVYSRSKRLKQPKATGQTSKLFRGGGR